MDAAREAVLRDAEYFDPVPAPGTPLPRSDPRGRVPVLPHVPLPLADPRGRPTTAIPSPAAAATDPNAEWWARNRIQLPTPSAPTPGVTMSVTPQQWQDIVAAGAQAPVTAQLTGSAEVHGETTLKVEVTTSSELLRIVDSMKTLPQRLMGSLNANGPGSLGKSSPDAAAPVTGGW